ncbi:MAG: prepilin peptidase, partial [Planctomycetota bacterium]
MGDAVTLVVVGIFGSMLGSFLNVVIYRLPRRESLVLPGSRCPSCETPIRWFDNLPLLSWLALRGRCRACKAAISLRYPCIEALTAALSVFVAARFLTGAAGADWARFVAVECLVLALVAVTFIDFDHRIIPDKITKPGMVMAPLFSIVAPGLHQTHWLIDKFPDLNSNMASLILAVLGLAVGGGTILLMGMAGKAVFK